MNAFSKDYLNDTDTLLITLNGLINPANLDETSTFNIYSTDASNNKIEFSNMTTVRMESENSNDLSLVKPFYSYNNTCLKTCPPGYFA